MEIEAMQRQWVFVYTPSGTAIRYAAAPADDAASRYAATQPGR